MISHLQSTTDNSLPAKESVGPSAAVGISKPMPSPSALLLKGTFFFKAQDKLAPIASYTRATRRGLGQ